MSLKFEKATKSQSKLRCAIFGPSGSGKTYSALRIAKGIGGKIAVIDTERGSASKYSDRFEFDKVDLDQKTIDEVTECLRLAEGIYDVVIIDSLSHQWTGVKEYVDSVAKSKFGGNSWAGWSEGNKKQKEFIDTLLSFPGHIIGTMRSDTAWEVTKDEKTGRAKPTKIGMKPEQGKNIEYEFDILLEMSIDNIGTVIKDRTGKFHNQIITKPDEMFGQDLNKWLSDGDPEPLLRDEVTGKLTRLTNDLALDEKKTYFSEIVSEVMGEKHLITKVSELKGDVLKAVLEIIDSKLVDSLEDK